MIRVCICDTIESLKSDFRQILTLRLQVVGMDLICLSTSTLIYIYNLDVSLLCFTIQIGYFLVYQVFLLLTFPAKEDDVSFFRPGFLR